jgi:hypothetical protein
LSTELERFSFGGDDPSDDEKIVPLTSSQKVNQGNKDSFIALISILLIAGK